jgi:hypothetical protein
MVWKACGSGCLKGTSLPDFGDTHCQLSGFTWVKKIMKVHAHNNACFGDPLALMARVCRFL